MSISFSAPLIESDREVAELIRRETERQEFGLEMIPSENFVSQAVLDACGSVLTNKYAEGLPGKRYYGGCEVVDEVEELAIARAKKLFGASFVNVQPHSGAQANHAVFEAVLKPGDTIMGMRLDHGGHLTHGHPMNVSGKHYRVVAYGVDPETHLIDFDDVSKVARENKPKLIICGASAYSRQINFKHFREIADEVGALLLADVAHYAGLIAAGQYPSPIGVAHFVTTTTHKTLRGPRSGMVMAEERFSKEVNRAVFPGLQGGPHMHTIAAKAVCFAEALRPEFKTYAAQVVSNARALGAALEKRGLRIISGGTDSHLLLIDLRPLDLTGKEAQAALDSVGITANKNTIPFDPQPPMVCSGIRVGTPALTTRGFGVSEMEEVAHLMVETIAARGDENRLARTREGVRALSARFPLYLYRL